MKWIFKFKYKNSEYERHKARIVALGYQQRKDVDYFVSFSPTASYVTIRLVLAHTALPHWYGVDLDATGAFISAPLPCKLIFRAYPDSISLKANACVSKRQNMVLCKLCFRISSCARKSSLKVGMRQLDSDGCVFVKCAQNIKGQPPLTVEQIIESGSFMTMDTVPKYQRVYPSCVYPVACVIIVMYLDNNGV